VQILIVSYRIVSCDLYRTGEQFSLRHRDWCRKINCRCRFPPHALSAVVLCYLRKWSTL